MVPLVARILVAGPEGLGARLLLDALLGRLRADGHEAARLPAEGTAEAVAEADALIAVLDGAVPAATAVWVGHAAALGKPLLGLHGGDAPPALLQACTRTAQGDDLDGLARALGPFYEDVRPFAGRLVRDHVPRLVEEAGHEVRFRELAADERPRFLKQKVHEEAKALLKADRGTEADEIADLLEALETLIRTRGFEREDLRRVKEGKLRRRGGFEKCYVVEATADAAAGPAPTTDEGTKRAPRQDSAGDVRGTQEGDVPATQEDVPAAQEGDVQAPDTARGAADAGARDAPADATPAAPAGDAGPEDAAPPDKRTERPPAFEI